MRIFVTAALAIASTAFGQEAVEGDEASAFVEWLRENAAPLQSVEAGNGFDDMQPLKAMVGEARIVAMGEATHGSREIFQMKHRMLEFLVEEMGFTIFGIEASYPDCVAISDYVLRGEGDPAEALHGQGFWTWDTEEVLALIEWMRAYNEDPAREPKLKFYGFDMQVFEPAVRVALPHLAQVDAEKAEDLENRFEPLMGQGRMQQYRNLTPAQRDALTEAVDELVTAMDEHKPSIEQSSSVEAFATARQHAVVAKHCEEMLRLMAEPLPGFDMEELRRLGMTIGDTAAKLRDFLFRLDAAFLENVEEELEQLHSSSFQMFDRYEEEMDDEERARWDALGPRIVEHLDRYPSHFVRRSSRAEYETAMKQARDVARMVEAMRKTAAMEGDLPNVRDRCMAENVAWILRQEGPQARIMLWAHNGHVSHKPAKPGCGSMGNELKRMFGEDHIVFGFSFNHGSFQAIYRAPDGQWDGGPGLRSHTVPPAPAGYVGEVFARAGMPILVADLRAAPEGSGAHQWLQQRHPMRSIGAIFSDALAESFVVSTKLTEEYDAIIFIDQMTRARPNVLTRQKFNMPPP